MIKAKGWLQDRLERDLRYGFVGHLDELVPELILEDDIYGKDRLTLDTKSKDLGAKADSGDWEVQFLWWNSETQSNWWDGLVRTAFIMEDEEYLEKVNDYVANKLSTQDKDGYLGIYGEDLRYNFSGENGELWAQTSLFRSLLGYYKYTQNQEVLDAVIKAVELTMQSYNIGGVNPFDYAEGFAGVSHGLMFVDILEILSSITSDKKYIQYAKWLYDCHSAANVSEKDCQEHNINDDEYLFTGHGVHTYEHIRVLVTLAYGLEEDNKYKRLLDKLLDKLPNYITPSGAPIGDEWIRGCYANATETGYEYCSIHELLHTYTLLLTKTQDPKWADKIEWLFINAAQGSRHSMASRISYLNCDNIYNLTGDKDPLSEDKTQTRYRYSPVHKEAAVCCVPNAGRITPYYVENMWHQQDDVLTLFLLGECVFETEIKGTKVVIEVEGCYQEGSECMSLEIKAERPIEFTLKIRKPKWAEKMCINDDGKENFYVEGDFAILKKEWLNQQCNIEFEWTPKFEQDLNGEYYVTKGPLLYALPIEHEEKVTKVFEDTSFREINYASKHRRSECFKIFDVMKEYKFTTMELHDKSYKSLVLTYYEKNKENVVVLDPFKETILRRTTFN
ncbi:hypothetical protein AN644_01850 [Candidatus Epulonipiscium fishelsonii]|nr:hypothetical protein AN644_01850 [Epulopiscium sp. SCG-C06WGA-EpuloA1]